jgi:hypothetical protein
VANRKHKITKHQEICYMYILVIVLNDETNDKRFIKVATSVDDGLRTDMLYELI